MTISMQPEEDLSPSIRAGEEDSSIPGFSLCVDTYYNGTIEWAQRQFALASQIGHQPGATDGSLLFDHILLPLAEDYCDRLIRHVLKGFHPDPDGGQCRTLAQIERHRSKKKKFQRRFFTIESTQEPEYKTNTVLTLVGKTSEGVLGFIRADFSGNALKTPALILEVHPPIKELEAAHNNLLSADFLQKFSALKNVNLSHNLLQSLPSGDFNALISADFSNNQITHRPSFTAPMLDRLSVAHNHIEDAGSLTLPALKILDIAHNRVRSLEFVKLLPQLAELYAAHNNIQELDGLKCHMLIEVTHLRGNSIGSVSALNCPRLRVLNLRQNVITDASALLLAVQSGDMPQLCKLSLLENDGLELDAETVRAFLSAGTVQRFNKQTLNDIGP